MIAERARALAAAILYGLTGRRFGCCDVTVRPCRPETACGDMSLARLIYWDQRNLGGTTMGVLSYVPTLVDGAVYNIACGCAQGCCSCKAACEVYLPGPVCSVSNVTVGGVVRDPSTYQVFDKNKLVFFKDELGENNCPSCQDYDKPLGEVGTWSVTYSFGVPVPDELNFAAGLYACELAKALVGQGCALPKNIASVARRGMDIGFSDPWVLIENGMVGLPVVDEIIKMLNPNKLQQPFVGWSPDISVVRRET